MAWESDMRRVFLIAVTIGAVATGSIAASAKSCEEVCANKAAQGGMVRGSSFNQSKCIGMCTEHRQHK
jgi:hypothetical protein